MTKKAIKRTIHAPMRPHIYWCKDITSDAYPTDTDVWHDEHTQWDLNISGELNTNIQDIDDWTEFATEALKNAVIERANERFDLNSKPSLCIEVLIKENEIEVNEETIEEKLKVPTKPKVPKYITGQIELMEERYKESEDTDEKIALKDEINNLKNRYNIEEE